MARISLYYDTRLKSSSKNKWTLKIRISHKRKNAYIPLSIYLKKEEWDKNKEQVKNRVDKSVLNSHIMQQKLHFEKALLELQEKHNINKFSVLELRELLLKSLKVGEEEITDLVAPIYCDFMNQKIERTKGLYLQTFRRLKEFTSDFETLRFSDINKNWLTNFDLFLIEKGNATNTRSIHLRNIRAVFNNAIDNEITNNYPFRRFKIKSEQTAKRSLSVEELRNIFNYQTSSYKQEFIDLFQLSFLFIGANLVDLLNATKKNIINGRFEYRRSKTKRLYSIKVEKEALPLLEKYKGENMLLRQGEYHKDYRRASAYANKFLKEIYPNLTVYWARHTWATIASSLDIPKETIAQALGHGGNTVTDIYIDFDRGKVDMAHRKVLDFVFNETN